MASVSRDPGRTIWMMTIHPPGGKPLAKGHANRAAADTLEKRHRGGALPAGRDNVGPGHDVEDAGQPARVLGVDPEDAGMRAVGTEEMGRDLAVDVIVGRVSALAGEQTEVFAPAPELMF